MRTMALRMKIESSTTTIRTADTLKFFRRLYSD
jgi:hypothetical protein